ncbi:MAG: type II toxin-antitoxin system HicB family antitoxin [Coprothermobacterota bacterium]|nr:type II toxin-antitoxin system HicB family antitoxin [Coprothermobacterota bacterium]
MKIEILSFGLHKEECLYVAECPEVGTVSQGYSAEEAVANLKEATELYLEEFPLVQVTRPLLAQVDSNIPSGSLSITVISLCSSCHCPCCFVGE